MEKRASTDSPIHDLIQRRWSPLAFLPRPIESDKLASVLEAARWAPSSRNEQPWFYIVARRDDAESFERLAGCLAPGNVVWARNAGALLLSVAKLRFDHNGSRNHHAWYDVGQATAFLVLQAVELGLVAHQMAGYDAAKARQECGIPDDYEPCAVTAIGYADVPESLPENLRSRELAARVRKPASQFAFNGRFGVPLRE